MTPQQQLQTLVEHCRSAQRRYDAGEITTVDLYTAQAAAQACVTRLFWMGDIDGGQRAEWLNAILEANEATQTPVERAEAMAPGL